MYSAAPSDQYEPVLSSSLPAAVVQLKYHHGQMFVGLANGTVGVFRRGDRSAGWLLHAPALLLNLGKDPVVALLPIGPALYVACGSDVFVLCGSSGEAQVWRLIELLENLVIVTFFILKTLPINRNSNSKQCSLTEFASFKLKSLCELYHFENVNI